MRISHQARLLLQSLLDSPEEEAYGFTLSRATGLKAGTLYPLLQRLMSEGWLTTRWEDVDEHAAGRRRRRYYRLTTVGEQHASAIADGDANALRQLMPGWGAVDGTDGDASGQLQPGWTS